MRAWAKAMGWGAGVVAFLVTGDIVAGASGFFMAGILLVYAIPVWGFTRNQRRLTKKGSELARDVGDVRQLIDHDAAAFRRVFAAFFPWRLVAGPAAVRQPPAADVVPDVAPDVVPDVMRVPLPIGPAPPSLPPDRGTQGSAPPTFWLLLTLDERRALLAAGTERLFLTGAVLCGEGTPADRVFLIRSGWTKVCVLTPDGERILARRGPGDLVGERAAMRPGEGERSATVVAEEIVRALVMSTEAFLAFIRGHQRVLNVLEGQLYGRLTEDRSRPEPRPAPQVPPPAYVPPAPTASPTQSAQSAQSVQSVPSTQSAQSAQSTQSAQSAQSAPSTQSAQSAQSTQSAQSAPPASRPSAQPLPQPSSQPASAPSWTGQNCSIVLLDVAAFGARNRRDADRLTIRRVMYQILRDAMETSGVPWTGCHRDDRGDGVLLIVPPATPTSTVVDALLDHLATRLFRHNEQATAATRFQLRVALDVGPVVSDPEGVSGQAIIHAARILDAPILKRHLAQTAADVGFIVSTYVYDNVITHHPGRIGPADYQRVSFQGKESKLTAWMHLVRRSVDLYKSVNQ